MMLGTCDIEHGMIKTDKTTYPITEFTTPDVRRPLRVPGYVIAGGLSIFGLGFADLLHWHELVLLPVAIAAAILVGRNVAQLIILDKVTRGTEQMSANFGTHATLQKKRAEINAEITRVKRGLS